MRYSTSLWSFHPPREGGVREHVNSPGVCLPLHDVRVVLFCVNFCAPAVQLQPREYGLESSLVESGDAYGQAPGQKGAGPVAVHLRIQCGEEPGKEGSCLLFLWPLFRGRLFRLLVFKNIYHILLYYRGSSFAGSETERVEVDHFHKCVRDYPDKLGSLHMCLCVRGYPENRGTLRLWTYECAHRLLLIVGFLVLSVFALLLSRCQLWSFSWTISARRKLRYSPLLPVLSTGAYRVPHSWGMDIKQLVACYPSSHIPHPLCSWLAVVVRWWRSFVKQSVPTQDPGATAILRFPDPRWYAPIRRPLAWLTYGAG